MDALRHWWERRDPGQEPTRWPSFIHLDKLNPRLHVSARLGLAVGFIVFTLALMLSLLLGESLRRQTEQDTGNSFAELAYHMANKLDRGMFERYREIQIMASLDLLRSPDASFDSKRALLQQLQSTYAIYAWIGLTDTDGRVLVSTGALLEGEDVSERPWFRKALHNTYIGDVHEAKLLASLLPNPSGEPLRFVDVAAPLTDEMGEIIGVLGAHLNWDWASQVQEDVLEPLQDRTGIEMYILSQNGTMFMGPAEALLPGDTVTVAFETAQQAETATSYMVSPPEDGKTYLVGYSRSMGFESYPGLGWTILVRQVTDIALSPAYTIQRSVLIWGLLTGALSATAAWYISRDIALRLNALAWSIEQISIKPPSLSAHNPFGRDEVASISNTMFTLIDALEQQNRELAQSTLAEIRYREQIQEQNITLEQRVAVRTAELMHTITQLEYAESELREALANEKALNELKSRFSSMVSHEFRTPLSVILSAAGMMERYGDQLTDEKRATLITRIQTQVLHLVQLLDEVLALDRAEAVGIQVQHEDIDLAAFCAALVDEISETASDHDISLTVTGTPRTVSLDPKLMGQAISNLLSNAVKYSPEFGQIRVNLRFEADAVLLRVADEGIGIPEDDLEHLFEAFHRAGNVRGISGTGLGLAIVKRSVEAHGGTITVQSVVGKGTTFTIWLPV